MAQVEPEFAHEAPSPPPVGPRPTRVSRVVADLDRAEAFYRDGLGFRRAAAEVLDRRLCAALDAAGACAEQRVLRLGAQEVALVRFTPGGVPYPRDSRSDDLWFQHLAIVVADMAAAWSMLQAQVPRLISVRGPQVLPRRNGGVTAVKLRDPDGHPLELIHFPAGQGRDLWQRATGGPFLGIDHSALAVSDTAASARFYRRLGFSVAGRSRNFGRRQSLLDRLPEARATVTGLRPEDPVAMGVELLAYDPPGRPMPPSGPRDALADWITVASPGRVRGRTLAGGDRARLLRDPDGHRLLLLG